MGVVGEVVKIHGRSLWVVWERYKIHSNDSIEKYAEYTVNATHRLEK